QHRQPVDGPRQPYPLVLPQVRHHVDAARHPAQQPARPRQRRPAHLVAVRLRHRPDDAGPPTQPAGEQAQRRGGSEPDRVAVVRPRELGRPPRHPGGRQQHGCLLPHDVERLVGVELRGPLPGGGVHHHRTGWLAYREVLHELLDAARTRRKVVRDQQGPAARRAAHGWALAQARAAAMRSTVDGWEANRAYSTGLGSTSPRLTSASRPCIAPNDVGSCVRASACASARASIRRDTMFCTGPATRPIRAATASSSAIERGSASDATPARRSSPSHEPSRYSPQTTPAAPNAPISVPVSTSLSLAWPNSCATTDSTSAGGASSSSVSYTTIRRVGPRPETYALTARVPRHASATSTSRTGTPSP